MNKNVTHGAARRIGTLGLNFILSGGLLPAPSDNAGVERADGVALEVDRIGAGRDEDPVADVEAEVEFVPEVEGLTSCEVEAMGFLGGMMGCLLAGSVKSRVQIAVYQ